MGPAAVYNLLLIVLILAILAVAINFGLFYLGITVPFLVILGVLIAVAIIGTVVTFFLSR